MELQVPILRALIFAFGLVAFVPPAQADQFLLDDADPPILNSNSVKRIVRLLGNNLPDGWSLGSVSATREFATANLKSGHTTIAVNLIRSGSGFQALIEPPNQDLQLIAQHVENTLNTAGKEESFWNMPVRFWDDPSDATAKPLLPMSATKFAQIALILATILALMAAPKLTAGISPLEVILLTAITIFGFAIRLYVEPRIPGWINGHGHHYLGSILAGPLNGADLHGNGPWAFFTPLLAIFPKTKTTVLATQLVISSFTIPAIWALARAFIPRCSVALWSAVLAALLPAFIYFGSGEERLVIGLLPFILAPVFASRPNSYLTMAAAGALAAAAAQFQPFLLLTPIAIGVVVLVKKPGWKVLPKLALSAAIFVLLTIEPAYQAISNVASGSGPSRTWIPEFGLLVKGLFLPVLGDGPGPSNTYLDTKYTPFVFFIFMVIGFIALNFKRLVDKVSECSNTFEHRLGLIPWGLLFLGTLFTALGFIPDRMHMLKLQLPAQPWFLVLSGAGMAFSQLVLKWLVSKAYKLKPSLLNVLSTTTLLVILGTCVVINPGPTFAVYGPQQETQIIEEGLKDAPDGCLVLWPAMERRPASSPPLWLGRGPDGPKLRWASIKDFRSPKPPFPNCTLYIRPLACWDHQKLSPGDPGTGIRAECAHAESRLAPMEPFFTKSIIATPDMMQKYPPTPVEIGIWTVSMVRKGGLEPPQPCDH